MRYLNTTICPVKLYNRTPSTTKITTSESAQEYTRILECIQVSDFGILGIVNDIHPSFPYISIISPPIMAPITSHHDTPSLQCRRHR